jgi:hypothetical protein
MAQRNNEFFWVLGGMALLGIVALVVSLVLLGGWMQPEPQAPDLRGRQPKAVTTHTASDDPPEPEPEPEIPAFDVSDLCPLDVVLEPEDGEELLEKVKVRATMARGGPLGGERLYADELEPLRWRFEDTPCGVATLKVWARDYVTVEREDVDTVVESELTISLIRGIRLHGVVTDVEGEPIEDARVQAEHSSDHTDAQGAYALRVDPATLRRVRASAAGYLGDSQPLRLPPETTEDAILDFELYRSREVTVYCAGMPDDSCESVFPIMCTWTLMPWGKPCWGEPTRCSCPEGRVAIRGAGQSVEVLPDEHEAWLDLRGEGGITGRVTRNDEPSGCEVMATYAPESLLEMGTTLMHMRRGDCDEEGRFFLGGLPQGRWSLQVMVDSGPAATRYPRIDQGEITDVGTIDLAGGGVIRGVVIDALTDQGAPGETVVAVGTEGDADNPASTYMATSGSEGSFEIRGMDDGSYQVICGSRPFTREKVEVIDGEGSRELELSTGAADLLADNGFSLITDEEGALEVDQVQPGSAAERAGLQPGDVIDHVLVGGIDISAFVPIPPDIVTEIFLEHYPGPGVSVVVDRDGSEHTIEL